MKPIWIIDHLLTDGNEQDLEQTIRNRGMECIKTKYVPFSDINDDLVGYDKNLNFVLYGTVEFCKQVNKQLKPIPGAYLNLKNLEFSTYACHYLDYMVNKRFCIKPFGVIQKEMIDIPRPMFIRPNAVTKEFAGQVVNDYSELDDINKMELISPETLCVTAAPKKIIEETRFVVVNGYIAAGSRYKRNTSFNVSKYYDNYKITDEVSVSKNYDSLAEKFLYKMLYSECQWRPDRVFVADVALYHDYGENPIKARHGLLEINSFSCAGLYACDLDSVVKYVSKEAEDEFIGN